MRKTIKQKIKELDEMKKISPNFDYGIHPLRCSCGMFLGHDGKKNLSFEERVIFCYSSETMGGFKVEEG